MDTLDALKYGLYGAISGALLAGYAPKIMGATEVSVDNDASLTEKYSQFAQAIDPESAERGQTAEVFVIENGDTTKLAHRPVKNTLKAAGPQ